LSIGDINSLGTDSPSLSQLELRLKQLVRRLLALGERPIAELLAEIGRQFEITADILEAAENYLRILSRIDPAVLQALGADRIPPPPLILLRTAS
jgi:hypothetical protein